jgi:predicted O-methyltransferase YrrM
MSFDDYILSHTTAEDPLLQELTRFTNLHVMNPRMLSGQVQGKFLEFISRMLAPSRILEIGSYTGYSAICLAKGLTDDGLLHTIDINDELRHIVEEYTGRSAVGAKIRLHTGDALKIVPTLPDTFDLAFIDGDKSEYIAYYEAVAPKMRKGGYIIADNVLWSGKILNPASAGDKFTRGLMAFNDHVQNDARVENLLLPLRDGIMMMRML